MTMIATGPLPRGPQDDFSTSTMRLHTEKVSLSFPPSVFLAAREPAPPFYAILLRRRSIKLAENALRLQPDMQIFSRRLHLTAEINDGPRKGEPGVLQRLRHADDCQGDLILNFSRDPWEHSQFGDLLNEIAVSLGGNSAAIWRILVFATAKVR